MKAFLCPVCNGVGKVASGFYNRSGDCPSWVSSGGTPEVCRSCNGRGWVEVTEENDAYTLGYKQGQEDGHEEEHGESRRPLGK